MLKNYHILAIILALFFIAPIANAGPQMTLGFVFSPGNQFSTIDHQGNPVSTIRFADCFAWFCPEYEHHSSVLLSGQHERNTDLLGFTTRFHFGRYELQLGKSDDRTRTLHSHYTTIIRLDYRFYHNYKFEYEHLQGGQKMTLIGVVDTFK